MQNSGFIWKDLSIHWESYIPLKEEKEEKNLRWQEIPLGEEAVCAYLGESLGDIYSHLGGRGKILKLIIFLPPYSFLPLCLQAKAKTCSVSHVSSRESTSKAGKVEKREQSEGKRSALCFVADYKIRKGLYWKRSQAEFPQSRCALLTNGGPSTVITVGTDQQRVLTYRVNTQGGQIARRNEGGENEPLNFFSRGTFWLGRDYCEESIIPNLPYLCSVPIPQLVRSRVHTFHLLPTSLRAFSHSRGHSHPACGSG